ncbi:type III polyketide synthase [Longispora urticae]
MVIPTVAGLGVALPPATSQEDLWHGYFHRHFNGSALAKRMFANAGVDQRHTVLNPIGEDFSGASTGERMRRYAAEVVPLGKSAVVAALADAGVEPGDLGLLAVATCTGYTTPGLDILLARDLDLDPGLRRLTIGHMGCYAALPGLASVSDYVAASGRPAVLLCAELTSVHVQPPTTQVDQIVSHALFSDGAAAVVVTPGGRGYAIEGFAARTDPATADHMTWEVTDHGFRMGLSPRVPDVLEEHIAPLVDELLGARGLDRSDVDGWALHPGGPGILAAAAKGLGLPAGALDASRGVLREHGNCSSVTVLLVLEALRAAGASTVVAAAFGPGLTLYGGLLRRVG